MKIELRTAYGLCPFTNEDTTIEIKYAQVPSVGNLSPGMKPCSFNCDYVEDCPNEKECPLWLEAIRQFKK